MQLYQPTITGSLLVSGSIVATGGITVTNPIASASYANSASYAATAISASYAVNATSASWITGSNVVGVVSNTTSASFAVQAQTASFANTFTVNSTLTAQTLVVQTITSSVETVTGSTSFGSLLTNTHIFSGSVTMNPGGLFVSSSGLVGIGTTSPSYTLDVLGNVGIGSGSLGLLVFKNTWTTGTINKIRAYASNDDKAIIWYYDNSPAGTVIRDNNSIQLTISGSSGLYINSGSNVGIGTTSPSYKLSVANEAIVGAQGGNDFTYIGGGSGVGSIIRNYYSSGGINNEIRGNGNNYFNVITGGVGIGTTNPGAPLEIYYSNNLYLTNPHLVLNNPSLTGQTHIDFKITGSLTGKIRSDYEGNMLYITNTFGSEKAHQFFVNGESGIGSLAMYIKSNGNIGIGVNTPGCSLDIGSKTDAMRLPNGTTGQRPTAASGMLRYNTSNSKPEYYNGSTWVTVGASGDGSSYYNAATSAKSIKAIVGNPSSGVYWLQVANVNSGNPFQCYCDFTIDGGIGYAIIFNQYFTGAETGPSTTSFASSTISTAGFDTEYQAAPSLMLANYGMTKLAVFARTGGSSSGGITGASYYNWVAFTGPSTTQFNNIFTNKYNSNQFTGTFNSSDGNTGTAYFPNSHGSTGGVTQVTNGTTVNDYILYEYNPDGGTDPNHFWMVLNGRSGDTYWINNTRYGSSSGNVMYNRWGGVAIY